MLKDQIQKYMKENPEGLVFSSIEREYVEKNKDFFGENLRFSELKPGMRFSDAFIERNDKETENFAIEEGPSFLDQHIHYLKKHKNEFIYVESSYWFNLIGVDAVSLEADDVFGTYDVMLGLKLQKKFQSEIKSFLTKNLPGDIGKFDLLFNSEDGLWDLNFALDHLNGFRDDMTIKDAFELIYQFLFKLGEFVDK